jgi:PAS domain-containing protein
MRENKSKADLILELKQAQKRIAELESTNSTENERFERVFHVSPAQMALTDITTGKYVEVNEAFLRILGFMREEVIGKTALELDLFVNPAQRTILLQRMNFVIAATAMSSSITMLRNPIMLAGDSVDR